MKTEYRERVEATVNMPSNDVLTIFHRDIMRIVDDTQNIVKLCLINENLKKAEKVYNEGLESLKELATCYVNVHNAPWLFRNAEYNNALSTLYGLKGMIEPCIQYNLWVKNNKRRFKDS